MQSVAAQPTKRPAQRQWVSDSAIHSVQCKTVAACCGERSIHGPLVHVRQTEWKRLCIRIDYLPIYVSEMVTCLVDIALCHFSALNTSGKTPLYLFVSRAFSTEGCLSQYICVCVCVCVCVMRCWTDYKCRSAPFIRMDEDLLSSLCIEALMTDE